jgi:hypothetical protein
MGRTGIEALDPLISVWGKLKAKSEKVKVVNSAASLPTAYVNSFRGESIK